MRHRTNKAARVAGSVVVIGVTTYGCYSSVAFNGNGVAVEAEAKKLAVTKEGLARNNGQNLQAQVQDTSETVPPAQPIQQKDPNRNTCKNTNLKFAGDDEEKDVDKFNELEEQTISSTSLIGNNNDNTSLVFTTPGGNGSVEGEAKESEMDEDSEDAKSDYTYQMKDPKISNYQFGEQGENMYENDYRHSFTSLDVVESDNTTPFANPAKVKVGRRNTTIFSRNEKDQELTKEQQKSPKITRHHTVMVKTPKGDGIEQLGNLEELNRKNLQAQEKDKKQGKSCDWESCFCVGAILLCFSVFLSGVSRACKNGEEEPAIA